MIALRTTSLALLVTAGVGCVGQPPDDGFFEGEGEGCCGVLRGEKEVTLRVVLGAPPQRFDIPVQHDSFAFGAVASVNVDAASDAFVVAVNGDPAFVDDDRNYAVVDVGSVASAGLPVDGSGVVSGFSFGVAAASADADVVLILSVDAEVEAADGALTLGRLTPRP